MDKLYTYIKENQMSVDIINMAGRLNQKASEMLGDKSQDFLQSFGQRPGTLDIFHDFLEYVTQEMLGVMMIKTSFKPKDLKRELYLSSLPINVKKRFLAGQSIPLNPFSEDKPFITKNQFELIKHASYDLNWNLFQDVEFKPENLIVYQDGFRNKFMYFFKIHTRIGEPLAFSTQGNIGDVPTRYTEEGSGFIPKLAQKLKQGFKMVNIEELN